MILWIAAAAVVLVVGLVDASHGISEVQVAKSRLSASELVSRGGVPSLRAAQGDFASSVSLLHSPLLTPFEVLPVLGRQLRSVQDLSSAAERTTEIGVTAIDRARAVLSSPHQAGQGRVTTLRQLARLASATYGELAAIDTGPSQALFSPLSHKRAEFVSQLDEVKTRLSNAAAVASSTATILQGPQTYLVLMSNPAEMRAGSGDFLEAGVMTTDEGEVHLNGLVPTAQVALDDPVPVTGDLEARWGFTGPGADFRNLGLTPQFDVNGPLAARMWQAATGQHVDGVLAIDVDALQEFLKVTGPVTLDDGQVIGSSNVVEFLTHDQYEGLTDEPTASIAPTEQARQDEIGTLAHSALDAMENESLDLRNLADAMTASTEGRHIMLWSGDPAAQKAWEDAGVAGKLSAGSLMTAVINLGANKLDQYLAVHCTLEIARRGSRAEATLKVDLGDHTPPGQSQYIAGPYPGLGTSYGEYVGQLAVNLPAGSSGVRLQGNPLITTEGPEGPTLLVSTPVDVKQGHSEQVVVRFDLPSIHGLLTVLPSARLRPVSWSYRGHNLTDSSPFTVSW